MFGKTSLAHGFIITVVIIIYKMEIV